MDLNCSNRFEFIGMKIELILNIIYCGVEPSCVDMECFGC